MVNNHHDYEPTRPDWAAFVSVKIAINSDVDSDTNLITLYLRSNVFILFHPMRWQECVFDSLLALALSTYKGLQARTLDDLIVIFDSDDSLAPLSGDLARETSGSSCDNCKSTGAVTVQSPSDTPPKA